MPLSSHSHSRSSKPSAGKKPTATGAVDFLRAHEQMAALLPTLTRMIALQKDCAKLLPAMFHACEILQYESGQLVLSTPSTAIAAKLKNQLPNLQGELQRLGWQVNAIRLKVQVAKNLEKSIPSKQLTLSAPAVSAFAELGKTLEETPRNHALRAALLAMVQRHR